MPSDSARHGETVPVDALEALRAHRHGQRMNAATAGHIADELERLRALVDGQPAPDTDQVAYEHQIDALLARVDAWATSVYPATPAPWALLGDMADLLKRYRSGPATPGPTREQMIDALNQSIVEQGYGETDIDPGDLLDALTGIAPALRDTAPGIDGAPEPPETQR